jgi:hypothetical protein
VERRIVSQLVRAARISLHVRPIYANAGADARAALPARS